MARPISRAAQRALEIEEDYPKYADKAPTDLQERLADWIMEKTGVTFATKKEEAAYREGVRLAVALRMKFQASPENQAAIAERAASREDEEVEAAKTPAPPRKGSSSRTTPPREAAPAVKATKAAAAKAAPAKATKAAKAAAAAEPEEEAVAEPVKVAGRRPARRPARAAATEADAPF
jgi:hypothetical protein